MLVVMAWDSPTGRWETIGQSVGRWQLTASLDTAMEAMAAVIVILICYNRRQRRQSSTRVSTGHQTLSEGIGVGRGGWAAIYRTYIHSHSRPVSYCLKKDLYMTK